MPSLPNYLIFPQTLVQHLASFTAGRLVREPILDDLNEILNNTGNRIVHEAQMPGDVLSLCT